MKWWILNDLGKHITILFIHWNNSFANSLSSSSIKPLISIINLSEPIPDSLFKMTNYQNLKGNLKNKNLCDVVWLLLLTLEDCRESLERSLLWLLDEPLPWFKLLSLPPPFWWAWQLSRGMRGRGLSTIPIAFSGLQCSRNFRVGEFPKTLNCW